MPLLLHLATRNAAVNDSHSHRVAHTTLSPLIEKVQLVHQLTHASHELEAASQAVWFLSRSICRSQFVCV